MSSHFSEQPTPLTSQSLPHNSKASEIDKKLPRLVLPDIYAFPPNRDTLGATSYFIVEKEGNILLDCPPWQQENQKFLEELGGVTWLMITHRNAMAKVKEIQASLGCQVLLQEQEAYLLPEVEVTSFREEYQLSSHSLAIWTPGYSPGSSCLYLSREGGILFSGRHLLPDPQGKVGPLRQAKTFHWPRQIRSLEKLRDRFSAENLAYICPGANTGFLWGKGAVEGAYERLAALDIEQLRSGQ